MNAKEIIKENGLDCTEKEFNEYYDNYNVDYSRVNNIIPTICTFDQLYRGNKIKNASGGKYYYFLTVGDKTYLQYHVPNVQGLVGIDDDNVDDVIKKHKNKLINDFVEGIKFDETINHFK